MIPISRPACCLLFLLATHAAQAVDSEALASCASLDNDLSRLTCYVRLSGRAAPLPGAANPLPASSAPAASSPAVASPAAPRAGGDASYLSQHWELDEADKQGTFRFRPHHPNYLVAQLTSRPNSAPFGPNNPLSASSPAGIDHVELRYQLGFKTKLVERAAGSSADLWFGYTQQSYWQAFNGAASRPFRETNYQPELMAVLPVNVGIGDLRLRFLNLGIAHQSNGQSGDRSRSWNRVYAQAGLEHGALSMTTRIWKRLPEGRDDDNPDILDYMGRGDLSVQWRRNGHELSLTARRNFSTRHGMLEAGWAFPLAPGLKGYVQLFSGYGQSMIDYNHAQQSLGLGVMIAL
jgi:phospholipase A1